MTSALYEHLPFYQISSRAQCCFLGLSPSPPKSASERKAAWHWRHTGKSLWLLFSFGSSTYCTYRESKKQTLTKCLEIKVCTYHFHKTRDPELRSLKLTLEPQLRCGFCSVVLVSPILPSQHPGGSKVYAVRRMWALEQREMER